jgi:hypothetical protein
MRPMSHWLVHLCVDKWCNCATTHKKASDQSKEVSQDNKKSSLAIFGILSPPRDECAYDRSFWRDDLWKIYAALQILWEPINFVYFRFMILNLLGFLLFSLKNWNPQVTNHCRKFENVLKLISYQHGILLNLIRKIARTWHINFQLRY